MSPKHLPKPNVDYHAGLNTPGGMKAMFCNPVYTGIGSYERMVDDDEWIMAALQEIEADGPEQFLVNMLYTLRLSMME